MTIKAHFNRSTTTKTASRVPVSFEISIWKSHLKETRLQLFFFFFFFFSGGDCFSLKTHTHTTYYSTKLITEIFHDNFAFLLSPTSVADVPRATSPVLGPPESSRSRALVAHAGLAIRQPPCYITWDIVANRHHYAQSKLYHMQLS